MPYADPEKQKQYFLEHYKKNKKKKKAYNKKYFTEHKEALYKSNAEWHKEHPGKQKKYRDKHLAVPENRQKAKEAVRVWTQNNPARIRRNHLKRAGWSPELWEEKYEEQNGVCAICKETQKNGRNLSADHDHSNITPRGLLCNGCNFMLGNARDNPTILEEGAKYLRKYSDA